MRGRRSGAGLRGTRSRSASWKTRFCSRCGTRRCSMRWREAREGAPAAQTPSDRGRCSSKVLPERASVPQSRFPKPLFSLCLSLCMCVARTRRGKTTASRAIAKRASVPMVYIPLEALMSKFYGESERNLAEILRLADALEDGCLLFVDEIDALATERGEDMHEATRRMLSVLLRHLDGLDSKKRSVLIAATNRAQDLDAALRSRFESSIFFGLPDAVARAAIVAMYAQHLGSGEHKQLAAATEGFAGRDLRDVCASTERRWAAHLIRSGTGGDGTTPSLPPLTEYLKLAQARKRALHK
mmetsp:Transcript_27338/g.89482  ORF Transcript_27338/g.89482 Transcript_27338/m.89482 type:complete len:299 (-) Transcript_27338:266-1162(-)